MAFAFADAGAQVVAVDVSTERLAELAKDPRLDPFAADVSVAGDTRAFVEHTLSAHGSLDVLCNNAGVLDRCEPAGEVSDETWRRTMSINLDGVFFGIRAAVPAMLAAGRGVIINTSSIAGLAGARSGATYTAAKHAVIGLTQNTAAAYGDAGIRCVAICPGAVDTGMTEEVREMELDGSLSARGLVAMGRTSAAKIHRVDPHSLASLAVFVASEAGSAINGAALVADGGWLAH